MNVESNNENKIRVYTSIKSMISIAIENAAWHDVQVHHPCRNNADGNCIFESVVHNINSRQCFGESWSGSPDYIRKLWLEEAEGLVWNFTGGLGRSYELFKKEWDYLKNGRNYECDLGDFVLPAVAHCLQKDILIFNTNVFLIQGNLLTFITNFEPIYVVQASTLANR